MKVLKQILIILVISAIIGFITNAINPNGVTLIPGEKDRIMFDTAKQKKELKDFVNDPYDTTKKNSNNMLSGTGKVNKHGFIEPENISTELAKNLFDRNALFIDARNKEEYDSVHVKGSISIPYEEFMKMDLSGKNELMKKYNKEGTIVVYCRGEGCDISIDLAYEIAKLGFTSVSIYHGGIKEWKAKGFPIQP